jgi:hypothetical protein
MSDARRAFVSGDRPEDVALFLAEGLVDDLDALAEYGDRVEDGMVLVMEGETGRSVFQKATNMEAMAFAGRAMKTEGEIAPDLTHGTCPKRETVEDEDDHRTRFVFAFVEEQTDDVDGLVADGDAVFAYAHCTCGAAYSQRWLVGDRSIED